MEPAAQQKDPEAVWDTNVRALVQLGLLGPALATAGASTAAAATVGRTVPQPAAPQAASSPPPKQRPLQHHRAAPGGRAGPRGQRSHREILAGAGGSRSEEARRCRPVGDAGVTQQLATDGRTSTGQPLSPGTAVTTAAVTPTAAKDRTLTLNAAATKLLGMVVTTGSSPSEKQPAYAAAVAAAAAAAAAVDSPGRTPSPRRSATTAFGRSSATPTSAAGASCTRALAVPLVPARSTQLPIEHRQAVVQERPTVARMHTQLLAAMAARDEERMRACDGQAGGQGASCGDSSDRHSDGDGGSGVGGVDGSLPVRVRAWLRDWEEADTQLWRSFSGDDTMGAPASHSLPGRAGGPMGGMPSSGGQSGVTGRGRAADDGCGGADVAARVARAAAVAACAAAALSPSRPLSAHTSQARQAPLAVRPTAAAMAHLPGSMHAQHMHPQSSHDGSRRAAVTQLQPPQQAGIQPGGSADATWQARTAAHKHGETAPLPVPTAQRITGKGALRLHPALTRKKHKPRRSTGGAAPPRNPDATAAVAAAAAAAAAAAVAAGSVAASADRPLSASTADAGALRTAGAPKTDLEHPTSASGKRPPGADGASGKQPPGTDASEHALLLRRAAAAAAAAASIAARDPERARRGLPPAVPLHVPPRASQSQSLPGDAAPSRACPGECPGGLGRSSAGGANRTAVRAAVARRPDRVHDARRGAAGASARPANATTSATPAPPARAHGRGTARAGGTARGGRGMRASNPARGIGGSTRGDHARPASASPSPARAPSLARHAPNFWDVLGELQRAGTGGGSAQHSKHTVATAAKPRAAHAAVVRPPQRTQRAAHVADASDDDGSDDGSDALAIAPDTSGDRTGDGSRVGARLRRPHDAGDGRGSTPGTSTHEAVHTRGSRADREVLREGRMAAPLDRGARRMGKPPRPPDHAPSRPVLPTNASKRSRQRKAGSRAGSAEVEARMRWERLLSRAKGHLSRLRRAEHALLVFSADGFRGANREKVRLTADMEAAEEEAEHAREALRETLRECEDTSGQHVLPDTAFDANGEIDESAIMCALCDFNESTDDNDIIMCDGSCNRAFHELCLDPPQRIADLPEDEGWLCPACSCKLKILDEINGYFGTLYDMETFACDVLIGVTGDGQLSHTPTPSASHAADAGPAMRRRSGAADADAAGAAGGSLLNAQLPSSDDSDEDWDAAAGSSDKKAAAGATSRGRRRTRRQRTGSGASPSGSDAQGDSNSSGGSDCGGGSTTSASSPAVSATSDDDDSDDDGDDAAGSSGGASRARSASRALSASRRRSASRDGLHERSMSHATTSSSSSDDSDSEDCLSSSGLEHSNSDGDAPDSSNSGGGGEHRRGRGRRRRKPRGGADVQDAGTGTLDGVRGDVRPRARQQQRRRLRQHGHGSDGSGSSDGGGASQQRGHKRRRPPGRASNGSGDRDGATSSGSESGTSSSEDEEDLILDYKRARTKVDYAALSMAMFGDGPPDEDSTSDDEW